MHRWLKRSLVAALLLTATLVIPEAQASGGESSVADVRNATARFHDLDKAIGADYVRLLGLAYKAAKGADPTVTVITAGLSPTGVSRATTSIGTTKMRPSVM